MEGMFAIAQYRYPCSYLVRRLSLYVVSYFMLALGFILVQGTRTFRQYTFTSMFLFSSLQYLVCFQEAWFSPAKLAGLSCLRGVLKFLLCRYVLNTFLLEFLV